MRPFYSRTRPTSAQKSVPGLTAPSLTDLLLASKEKDVTVPQLALESARTQLFLNAEQKRSERERLAIQQVSAMQKYDEAINTVEKTQTVEMEAVRRHNEVATEAIMDRFRTEIENLKETHRKEVERFVKMLQEMTEERRKETEMLQEKYVMQVRRKEEQQKNAALEINCEHERKIEMIRLQSEEIIAEKRTEIREKVIKRREKALKETVEALCGQKLIEIRAGESEFQSQICEYRGKIARFQSELSEIPMKTPEFSVPLLENYAKSAISTNEACTNTETPSDFPANSVVISALERVDKQHNSEIEVLEAALLSFNSKISAKIAELEAKYTAIVAECRSYEVAIGEIATEA